MWFAVADTVDALDAAMSSEHRDPYSEHLVGFRKSSPKSRRSRLPPENVAAEFTRR
jgi:hypothetical protein